MTVLHMGALHPVEQVLVLVLAFGPFLLLALVVWLRRRADRREELLTQGQGKGQDQDQAQSQTGDQVER